MTSHKICATDIWQTTSVIIFLFFLQYFVTYVLSDLFTAELWILATYRWPKTSDSGMEKSQPLLSGEKAWKGGA